MAVEKNDSLSSIAERKDHVKKFLRANPVGVLATVDPNNNPHGTVIYFSVNDDLNVMFTTKTNTKKSDNIKHNNRAQLVVFEKHSQTVVQILGTVQEVSDSFEAEAIFAGTLKAATETSDSGLPPISKLVAGPYIAYRLVPTQVRMAVYAKPKPGERHEIFETIENYEF